MNEITKDSFEQTIVQLLTASAKSSSKGDPMKDWFLQSFNVRARVARITEDKQQGNRILEQFSHKDSIVVFVLAPAVNRQSFEAKIKERQYKELSAVLIVVANSENPPYQYKNLLVRTPSSVTAWLSSTLSVAIESLGLVSDQGSIVGDFRQRIFYGAPGTGKSKGVNDVISAMPKEDIVRTTFHPDSDYSTFVGAYKPKMESVPRTMMKGEKIEEITQGDAKLLVEKRISYEFVPQAFAKAYVQAWKRMAVQVDGKTMPVMLVIEEINRGDCAKVFGDLFQLLDRRVKDDDQNPNDPIRKVGFSEYPVLADSDLADYIRDALKDEMAALANAGYGMVVAEENLQLVLPPNMYIWATMNTSDQSLFPMDSAFKRRWDWKYTPIKEGKQKDKTTPLGWTIKFTVPEKPADGNKAKVPAKTYVFDWWKFLKNVNEKIFDQTNSEDKQMGYFFVKADDAGVITGERFVEKVIFYLWNDVFKDFGIESIFSLEKKKDGDDEEAKGVPFRKFFAENGEGVDYDVLVKFFEYIKLSAESVTDDGDGANAAAAHVPPAPAPAAASETEEATETVEATEEAEVQNDANNP